MKQVMLYSAVVIGILGSSSLFADSTKKENDYHANKQCYQATITKVDTQNNKITFKMKDEDGKSTKKTLQISKDAKIQDRSGDKTKLSAFHAGEDVLISEKNDKVTEIKEYADATITKVDAQAGTVTVKMENKDGKEVTKTFKLIEETSYVDSNGNVAVLDIFKSGDKILMVEAEGRLRAMKKNDKHDKSTNNSTFNNSDTNKKDKNKK